MTTLLNLHRFDLGQITTVERTPQGFLKIPGYATRTGVFTYRDASGNVRHELRHPEDVFAAESLATLKNVPVTLEHPPVMVTPDNYKLYSRGYTTDRVDINGHLVETDSIVAEEEAIRSVEARERQELSCGYLADLDDEAGVYEGTPYTHRQRNIRYNHLAIVKAGRGGPEIRLRLDSEDAVMVQTRKIKIAGVDAELPLEQATVVENYIKGYDNVVAKLKTMEAQADMKQRNDQEVQANVKAEIPVEQKLPDGRSAGAKADADKDEGKKDADKDEEKKDEDGDADPATVEALKEALESMSIKCDSQNEKIDALQAKLDAMEDKPAKKEDRKDSKDFVTAVRERRTIERAAERVLPSEQVAKFDGMSDDEIRSAVIMHRSPKAELKGKSSVYIATRFDSIVEGLEEGTTKRNFMGRGFMNPERLDAKESDPAAARAKAMEESRNQWKQPLSASKK